jgi:GR25 family glycosyltransferase involved in LPS biosynthesis
LEQEAPFHILEDDVVLSLDFEAKAEALLSTLPDWDIVLWSHNFDWPVVLSSAQNMWPATIQYRRPKIDISPRDFRSEKRQSALLPLASAAGLGSYTISPRGAARMLKACLPIGNTMAPYALQAGVGWENSGLDVEMSRHYAKLRSFIAIPPLALAINDHNMSTIRSNLVAK